MMFHALVWRKTERSRIDAMIILDRWVDPITPLVTQLTYEGLIDEIYSIQYGRAEMPAAKFAGENEEVAEGATKTILLSSSDDLYNDLRDLNFNAVGPALRAKIKAISAKMDERHSASTIREYQEFVRRLPELQAAKAAAAIHTAVAELLKSHTSSDQFLFPIQAEQDILNSVETDKPINYILDSIAQGAPIKKVLRLIALQSLTTDGLKPKVLDQYRRELIQSYGSGVVSSLVELGRAGLISRSGDAGVPQRRFPVQRKTFRLIAEHVDEQKPNDLAFAYSGYAPLSCRLVEWWVRPGWAGMEETLGKVEGATGLGEAPAPGKPATLLVLLVGGITAGEMAALRWLAARNPHLNLLLASTAQITALSLLPD